MADKKVILEVELIEGNANSKLNELKASLQSLDKTHKDYEPTLKLIAQAERDLSKAQQNRILVEKGLVKSTVKVEKVTKKTAKEMKQLSTNTGASTSATLELGRIMSDAPYGIRGMANNIQQLASNLFFMSKKTVEATGKTVGFGGAVKSLVGGLWGATGALVAFQGLIALWDWYSNRTDKATDSTEDATNATKDLSSELKSLEKILSDSGLSLESYNEKIEDYIKLKVQQKKLDESILKTAVKIEEQRKIDSDSLADDIALAERLKQAKKDSADQALIIYEDTPIGRQAKAQAVDHSKTIQQIQSRISNNILVRAAAQKEIIRLTKEELDDITKIENAKKELAKAEVGTLKFLKEELSDKKKIRETTALTNEEYKEQGIKIAEIQKQIEIIEGSKKKAGKSKKISPFKTPEELELDVKNNLSAIDKLQKNTEIQLIKNKQKEELSLATTEEQKKQIKEKYASENLEVQIKYELKALDLKAKIEKTAATEKQNDYVKGLDAKLVAYEKSLRNEKGVLSKASKDALAIATTETEGLKKKSKKELAVTIFGIQEEYAKLFPFWVQLTKARRDALGIGDAEDKESDIKKLERYAKKAKEILNGIGDFVDAEYQRELSIEQNKTNVLNNELNQRLLNENLSKEQRKTIQNEIAQNDEKLRKKQESIEKKRFKAQKAINIATALIDTGVAAVKALKNNGGVPTGLPAMFGTIALGLAQVATIARTKFQSSAGSSPALVGGGSSSSSGSGTARAEASFNIVGGRTKEDALLGAIQAKFDQPVRAYVVSGDVTSQQELDRVIVSSSSL